MKLEQGSKAEKYLKQTQGIKWKSWELSQRIKRKAISARRKILLSTNFCLTAVKVPNPPACSLPGIPKRRISPHKGYSLPSYSEQIDLHKHKGNLKCNLSTKSFTNKYKWSTKDNLDSEGNQHHKKQRPR